MGNHMYMTRCQHSPGQPDQKIKVVAGLLYPGALSLDLSGPLDAFDSVWLPMELASTRNGKAPLDGPEQKPAYRQVLLAQDTKPVETMSGIKMVADFSIEDFDEPIDTLIVPGMKTGDLRYRQSPLIHWIQERAESFRRLASVCSGAMILAEAGLLDGRRATTHWMDSADMARMYPKAQVVGDQIFVKDGHIYSSGGVTAGIDLALSMIEEDHGHRVALQVAKRLIVPLKRSGDQTQFSNLLQAQGSAHRFGTLLDWIERNLAIELDIAILASQCSMSERNFSRQFAMEMDASPMQYIRMRRLECAKLLLENTEKPISQVASETGFGGADSFRRQFVQHNRIGPRQYRAQFGRGC